MHNVKLQNKFKPLIKENVFFPEIVIPQPLLDMADCANDTHLGCSDSTCIPAQYFCDGSIDCTDSSDEVREINNHIYFK